MASYLVTCFHLHSGVFVDGGRQPVEAADSLSAVGLFIDYPLSLTGRKQDLAAEVIRFEGTRVAEYQLYYFGI